MEIENGYSKYGRTNQRYIHIEPNHVDVNYAENWELTELEKNKVNIFFGC